MKLLLKSLELQNFKGFRNSKIEFSDITNIYGTNGTGKTSIFDAFTWLLFNKNSEGRTFDVRTQDKDGNVIEKIEHSVEAILDVDGESISLKKILKEKWVRKRGAEEETYTGCGNEYFWNAVPLKEKEFAEKVKNLIDEDLFKIITDPLKFNTMHWKDRQKFLFELAGVVSDSEIISSNPEFSLLKKATENKTIDELQKETASESKNLKKELNYYKPRIDEAYNSKMEIQELPYDKASIEAEINRLFETKNDIAASISQAETVYKSLGVQISKKQKDLYSTKSVFEKENMKKENDFEKQLYQIESKINQLTNEIAHKSSHKDMLVKDCEEHEKRLDDAREEAALIKQRIFVFDENEGICPTCNRVLEEADIQEKKEELAKNFEINKKVEYGKIYKYGIEFKDRIERNKSRILILDTEIEELITSKISLEDQKIALEKKLELSQSSKILFEDSEQYKEISAELSDLQRKLESTESDSVQARELNEEFSQVNNRIQELNSMLVEIAKIEEQKNYNARVDARISELKNQEKETAKKLAEIENFEYLIEKFMKVKIEKTEEKINGLFKITKFKLFNYLNNGGVEETCIALHDGIPWGENLNKGAMVNVGLDIINALVKFYGKSAPIFIDNRESIVNIIDVNSQIINLKVDEQCSTLKIDNVDDKRVLEEAV